MVQIFTFNIKRLCVFILSIAIITVAIVSLIEPKSAYYGASITISSAILIFASMGLIVAFIINVHILQLYFLLIFISVAGSLVFILVLSAKLQFVSVWMIGLCALCAIQCVIVGSIVRHQYFTGKDGFMEEPVSTRL